MPEQKWNNWIYQTPPLQYIQAISVGGRCVMSDSPQYNITCALTKQISSLSIFQEYISYLAWEGALVFFSG